MAFNVTSNFAGKAAGFYISAALKQATSLDFLTVMENVKYKSNIQRMAGSTVVRDATCDFTDHGTLALTEKDATVIQSAASGAYVAGNIIANLQTLTADMAANISPVLRKEDLHIYMNAKTYALYISAISTLGYVNAYNMNGDYEPVFEGYKIAVCPGMVDNQLVAAEKSNLFFGTDLLSDATRIQLMDMSLLDGSDNVRVVARYSGAVQTGVGADIVRQS